MAFGVSLIVPIPEKSFSGLPSTGFFGLEHTRLRTLAEIGSLKASGDGERVQDCNGSGAS